MATCSGWECAVDRETKEFEEKKPVSTMSGCSAYHNIGNTAMEESPLASKIKKSHLTENKTFLFNDEITTKTKTPM
eukprot:CAMPEP_0194512790 /NCGR_PEP_ID=MMETSP0253-20130528/44920_1 /TAXON_ID=2966 /ORGANISM="Noctiluca scintillans" /LENGTH=75 /DNA_ID=CAMNT_0039356287 /DNA_START=29 /DNA_END=256 /DNA_ORIENTATION=+